MFTPSLLFLFPALDPAFPRLDVHQAIALGLIVECVGYSSAALGYWRERRVELDVARPILMITLPTAVLASWVGLAIPDRWVLLIFGLILFGLAFVFLKFHRVDHPAPQDVPVDWRGERLLKSGTTKLRDWSMEPVHHTTTVSGSESLTYLSQLWVEPLSL